MPLPLVLSVNVGMPRRVEWAGRHVVTSIWKSPLAGRVDVAGDNVAGDAQSDRRVHGGPDKAVYAYAIEDYQWWEEELGASLAPGTFGENLTLAGLDLGQAVVGQTWEVGTARLVVTQPRMPCFKLGMRMGDAGFVSRFDDARRYGVYLRIAQAGEIGAGDAVRVGAGPAHGLTVSLVAEIQKTLDADGMERLAGTPDVPSNLREWAGRQLARGHVHRSARGRGAASR
jgi:MOSC domain-containing protein YiiM